MLQYLEYLVTSSSSLLVNLFHNIVLESPVVGSEFLDCFSQALLVIPHLSLSVFASSKFRKQIVYSRDSIILLYEFLFGNFNVGVNP